MRQIALLALSLLVTAHSALAAPTAKPAASADTSRIEKLAKQGVPRASVKRILRFLKENKGRDLNMDAYSCAGWRVTSEAACHPSRRANLTRAVHIEPQRYAAVIDMSLPSTEARMYVIDLVNLTVEKHYVTHGRGSGTGRFATKFSNRDKSHQTSLGLYVTGGTYRGHYGPSLRLYGLEKSNNKAYDRDIVIHPAWYASEKFISMVDKKTGKVRNRLGLSHGCPALAPAIAKKVIKKLKGGTIIDIYHPTLMDNGPIGEESEIKNIEDDSQDGALDEDEDQSQDPAQDQTPAQDNAQNNPHTNE